MPLSVCVSVCLPVCVVYRLSTVLTTHHLTTDKVLGTLYTEVHENVSVYYNLTVALVNLGHCWKGFQGDFF